VKKLQTELSKSEKEKLFKAIGYSSSTAPLYIPEKYISILIRANLDELKIAFSFKEKKRSVLIATLLVGHLSGEFHYRTARNSFL